MFEKLPMFERRDQSVYGRTSKIFAWALIAGSFGGVPARAQDVATFYRTHTLTLGSPNSPGGGYDIYVRALARHIAQYIPGNPSIIVQNVPAAGGMALANQIYNTVPKDGSYFGMVRGTAIQEEVYKSPQVQFSGRGFSWIGNMNSDHDACIVSAGSGVRSISDLYTHEVVAGASGVGAQSFSFPVVYRKLLGMKFKVISGYPGTPERMLALERGEITGACGISLSLFRSQFSRLLDEGRIRLIAQGGITKDPRYLDLPNILDEAKSPELRQALEFLYLPLALGRSLAAPPEIPADRLAVLRAATREAMKDPQFLAEAKKLDIDIAPMGADETVKMVDQLFATPPATVAKIEAALAQ
ncbi:MAG TPA: tripartite tricarboxylate transporter substrate-binding protein [Xanthobacteraceae bacterium]|nr:tripartite tricarboxylate transporter substrate-binding protein [Xanthobacteraceae bacterium]